MLTVQPAPGGGGGASMTLLGTLTMTSGSTQSLTGIAAGYRKFYCELDGVSINGTTTVQVAISSTNGAAYGAASSLHTYASAADVLSGWIEFGGVSSTVANAKTMVRSLSVAGAILAVAAFMTPTNTAAVADAIQFSASGGSTFDAGTIRIYGVK